VAVIRNLVVKIAADISSLTKGLKTAESKLLSVSNKLSSIGTSLSLKVTMPLVLLAKQALTTSAEFEQSMANAASVSGATGEELEKMTALAREMGKTTVFSASEAADAMYYLASAGYKVSQMADSIQPILNLAAATQSELAFTTDTVISTLNQFGLEASDASRVTNVFASVIGNSQATLEKLSYSMRYVGPVAKSLGYSIEETSAALGILYNSGFKGEQAGTVLRGALTRLLKPTADMKNALEELGLSEESINPATNSLAETIGVLETAGINTTQAVRIFGTEAGPGMMAMISQGADALTAMTEKITDTNSAAEMAEKQLDTMQGSAKLLKSMLEETAITIGDILIPMLRKLSENNLMPLVEKFNNLSQTSKELIVKIGMIAAGIGPAVIILAKIIKSVSVLIKIIGLLASPIALIIAAIVAVVAALVYMFKTNKEFKAKVLKLWDKIKTGILNAVNAIKDWFAANGKKILAVFEKVFIVIFSVIEKTVNGVISVFKNLGKGFKNIIGGNTKLKKNISSACKTISADIKTAFDNIENYYKENGAEIIASVKETLNTVWQAVVSIFNQIVDSLAVFLGYIEPIWEQIKTLFMSLWHVLADLYELLKPLLIAIGAVIAVLVAQVIGMINGVIQAIGPLIQAILNVLQIITDVVGAIVNLLQGDLDGVKEHLLSAWSNVKDFFVNLFQGILNYFKGFIDGFLNFFNSFGVDVESKAKEIFGKIKAWFEGVLEDIKTTAKNIYDAVVTVFSGIGNFFKDLFKQAFDWGKNLIQCIVDGINSAIEWVGDSIKSVGQKIKDFLGFSSPTKEGPGKTADEWMPNLMNMMSEGIRSGLPDIESAVNLTAGSIKNLQTPTAEKDEGGGLVNSLLSALSIIGKTDKGRNTDNINLSIDGQVFARLILPELNREFKRNGLELKKI
jgi:TP901 family phage tail tape measure protein